jgi:hypothetical protein
MSKTASGGEALEFLSYIAGSFGGDVGQAWRLNDPEAQAVQNHGQNEKQQIVPRGGSSSKYQSKKLRPIAELTLRRSSLKT